jgi:hypothetical protein
MKYQTVKDLAIEYKLKDALDSIRDIWYQLSEGFAAIPESAEKFQSFLEYFQEELPKGWILSMDKHGNIQAYTTFPSKFSQLFIYKSPSGKELVRVLPIVLENHSPVI